MLLTAKLSIIASALLPFLLAPEAAPPASTGLEYSTAGELKFPARYREWVFLSSGVGMTYGPAAAANVGRPKMFDNVYVNPESYRAFLESGKWPDKTQFVLEIRSSESIGSINKGGNFQTDLAAIEMNVKDSSSPNGEWVFYNFQIAAGKAAALAKPIPKSASCYTCHTNNTAVENTFVQFYPVLYEVAQNKGTVRSNFEKLPLNLTQLEAIVINDEWSKAEAALDGLAAHAPGANSVSEATLNQLGYRLIQIGKAAKAVSLLEWTAQQYPKSVNLQDSLADAYVAAGNKAAARAATERELKMAEADPTLDTATRKAIAAAASKRLKSLE